MLKLLKNTLFRMPYYDENNITNSSCIMRPTLFDCKWSKMTPRFCNRISTMVVLSNYLQFFLRMNLKTKQNKLFSIEIYEFFVCLFLLFCFVIFCFRYFSLALLNFYLLVLKLQVGNWIILISNILKLLSSALCFIRSLFWKPWNLSRGEKILRSFVFFMLRIWGSEIFFSRIFLFWIVCCYFDIHSFFIC